ncbi:MAG: thiocillin family RiPP [Vicinamibacterales bacterium]
MDEQMITTDQPQADDTLTLELYAEEMPDQIDLASGISCVGSAGSLSCASSATGCLGTLSCASTVSSQTV